MRGVNVLSKHAGNGKAGAGKRMLQGNYLWVFLWCYYVNFAVLPRKNIIRGVRYYES